MAIEFVMLFTTINKTKKRNVYIYMYMFYNKIDKSEKKEEQKNRWENSLSGTFI